MTKPTLFFSHSSKDKDLIISIKNKLTEYTGGTLDIFMSSDGQSIPFGTNWIHKVEEGLNNAKVMFVFVTMNSTTSGWIYFEAGFAYSKGIHVIPVGLGVDIGTLKAPLNLLQGFNITSADSLNNFISIINEEFEFSFPEKFDADDYSKIVGPYVFCRDDTAHSISFDKTVRSINSEIKGTNLLRDDEPLLSAVNQYFESMKAYLTQSNISYSVNSFDSVIISTETNGPSYRLMVMGIDISFYLKSNRMITDISRYNFADSFDLFCNLNRLLPKAEAKQFSLVIVLDTLYSVVSDTTDCAALISANSERFSFVKNSMGNYEYKPAGLQFGNFCRRNNYPASFSVTYSPTKNRANDIIELISQLYEMKVIYKRTGEDDNT